MVPTPLLKIPFLPLPGWTQRRDPQWRRLFLFWVWQRQFHQVWKIHHGILSGAAMSPISRALQNAQSIIFVSDCTLHPLTYLTVTFRGKCIYKWARLQHPTVPFTPQTFNYVHQLLLTVQRVGGVYPPSFLSYSARSCGSLKASLFICCVLQSLTLAQHAKRKPILLFPVVLIGRACCLPLH